MPTRYQMNVPQHPDDNYSINKAFDRNYGNRLKSGDTTPLKYTIKDGDGEPLDKDRLMGMETTVKMKHEGVTAYEAEFEATLEEVSEGYEGDLVARYKIMEALPPSDTPYIVEFHFEEADDRFIFPSGNNLPLYITPSSLNSDGEAIKNASEQRLNEIVERKLDENPVLSEAEAKELARQENYQELLDTGVMQTKINERLEDLEEEYAPKLTEVTAQLAQKVNELDVKKINKNVGAVTSADLSQEVKEQMTGGSVAVVGQNSVLEENIVDGQVTPQKTNFLSPEFIDIFSESEPLSGAALTSGASGVVYDNTDARSLIFPIQNNKNYRIIKSASDRFRIALRKNPKIHFFSSIDKPIVDDDSLNEFSFNSGIYNYAILYYSASGQNPIIQILADETYKLDKDKVSIGIDNVSDLLKHENHDIYSDDMQVEGLVLGVDFRVLSAPGKSLIIPLVNDTDYKIVKEPSSRFRVGLFNNYPISGAVASGRSGDDETLESVSFNSGSFNFCLVTYTITSESPLISVLEDLGGNILNSDIKINSKNVVGTQEQGGVFKEFEKGAVISSTNNPSWSGWSETRMNFGMNTDTTPTPASINSPLLVAGTIIAGGRSVNLLRWGFHVFEGYAQDNLSRITMLVNKHIEEGLPVAELYYYLTEYNHSEKAYGWFRLGSDVKDHSYLFGRDKAIAFGEWDMRNVMTLARISPANDLLTTYQTKVQLDAVHEAENDSINNAKGVLYLALKNAQNGAMFYDTDRNSIVIKKNGVWCDMDVTPVPEGTYNF